MMAKSIIFIALMLCFFQACGPGKENPVWPGSGQYATEYVGIGIYIDSIDDSLRNPQYFNGGRIFRKEDPFNKSTLDSLYEFDRDFLGSAGINLRANTYPINLDSLQFNNWEEKKEEISWQWRFWHLSELQSPAPYASKVDWKWISALFTVDDILKWPSFISKLKSDGDGVDDSPNPSKRILSLLSPEIQYKILSSTNDTTLSKEDKSTIVKALNGLLERRDLNQEEDFSNINLPEEAKELLERDLNNLSSSDIQMLNWLLIAAAYPDKIVQTPSFFPNKKNQQEVKVVFPCPDRFKLGDTVSFWRIEVFMFDANGDSLGLPDSYELEIKGRNIKGLPIRVTCGN